MDHCVNIYCQDLNAIRFRFLLELLRQYGINLKREVTCIGDGVELDDDSSSRRYNIPTTDKRTITTHVRARRVIALLDETLRYACMKLKSKKSRSSVLRKGQISKLLKMKLQQRKNSNTCGQLNKLI